MRRLSSDVNNRPTIQCTVSESVDDHVYFGPPKKIADFQKHKNMYGMQQSHGSLRPPN